MAKKASKGCPECGATSSTILIEALTQLKSLRHKCAALLKAGQRLANKLDIYDAISEAEQAAYENKNYDENS
jgi:hypothetical protein